MGNQATIHRAVGGILAAVLAVMTLSACSKDPPTGNGGGGNNWLETLELVSITPSEGDSVSVDEPIPASVPTFNKTLGGGSIRTDMHSPSGTSWKVFPRRLPNGGPIVWMIDEPGVPSGQSQPVIPQETGDWEVTVTVTTLLNRSKKFPTPFVVVPTEDSHEHQD